MHHGGKVQDVCHQLCSCCPVLPSADALKEGNMGCRGPGNRITWQPAMQSSMLPELKYQRARHGASSSHGAILAKECGDRRSKWGQKGQVAQSTLWLRASWGWKIWRAAWEALVAACTRRQPQLLRSPAAAPPAPLVTSGATAARRSPCEMLRRHSAPPCSPTNRELGCISKCLPWPLSVAASTSEQP